MPKQPKQQEQPMSQEPVQGTGDKPTEEQAKGTTESGYTDPNSPSAKSEREGGDAPQGPQDNTSDFLKVSEAAANGEDSEENPAAREVDDENRESTDTPPVNEFRVPEDYDPANDPLVPSSDVAQTIRTELEGTGESNTLKALHDALKATEGDQ